MMANDKNITFRHVELTSLSYEIYELMEIDGPINRYVIKVFNPNGK
jgi:hypothetical protein